MDYSLLLAVEENPNYHDMVAPIKGLNKKSGSFKYNEMSLDVVNISMDMSRKASINTEPMINSYFKLFEGKRHIFMSSNMKYVYHIAIIDYLQVYNLDKKFENFVKEIMVGRRAEISAVPPARYAKRYVDFMENQVFIVDKKCLNIGADKSNNESQIYRD